MRNYFYKMRASRALPLFFVTSLLLVSFSTSLLAQTDSDSDTPADSIPAMAAPAQVTDLKAFDTDNDHGHSITIEWTLSADDGAGAKSVISYEIMRWEPFVRDSVMAARDSLGWVQARINKFEKEIPLAEESLDEVLTGQPLLDSLSFLVAYDKKDTSFVLTSEYVDKTLRDTIAVMQRDLPVLKVRAPLLPARFDSLLVLLPKEYGKYPDATIGRFDSVGTAVSGVTSHENSSAVDSRSPGFISDFIDFYYRVDVQTSNPNIRTSSEIVGPVQSSGQWFNSGLITVLIAILIFTILTMIFVQLAKKGMDLYVRPLAGIEAVDEAIGRATEMGRPILYVLGLGSAADIATIASFTILGRVAKKVAEYQTELNVPCYDPIVMAVAQEVVKSAFIDAGRPEAYKDDIVHFITNSQFAYVGAVNGIIMRDLPATNVYMGKFFAESLILAETGAVAGSIQIAGTDEIPQIPFFFVACDYTLIGEELFAASAYLGREPELLGSLKAQDYAKAVLLASAIIGILLINIFPEYGETFKSWFEVID